MPVFTFSVPTGFAPSVTFEADGAAPLVVCAASSGFVTAGICIGAASHRRLDVHFRRWAEGDHGEAEGVWRRPSARHRR